MLVEAIRVECCDLVVLLTVVHEQLSASTLEFGQLGWVGTDITRIEVVGYACGFEAKCRCVPERVSVDDIL